MSLPPLDAWLNRYAVLSQRLSDSDLRVPLGTEQQGQPLPDPQWVDTSDSAAGELGWPEDWWQAWPQARLPAPPPSPRGR